MPKRPYLVQKVNFLGSGGQFGAKKLTSMAPAGKLIIDQKKIFENFFFFL